MDRFDWANRSKHLPHEQGSSAPAEFLISPAQLFLVVCLCTVGAATLRWVKRRSTLMFFGLAQEDVEGPSRRRAAWLADVEFDTRARKEWLDAVEKTGHDYCYSETDIAAIVAGETFFERIAKLAVTQGMRQQPRHPSGLMAQTKFDKTTRRLVGHVRVTVRGATVQVPPCDGTSRDLESRAT